MTEKLTDMQKSILLETGNIGSGHAAISLSQLMGKKIMIAVPSINIVSCSDIEKFLPMGDKEYIHIIVRVLGDIRGFIIFTMDADKCLGLYDSLTGQEKGSTLAITEMVTSALKEIGSIMGSSYLNAVSKVTGFDMTVSIPVYKKCKIRAALDILPEYDKKFKKIEDILCIHTEFIESKSRFEAFLMFAPVKDSLSKIFKSVSIKHFGGSS